MERRSTRRQEEVMGKRESEGMVMRTGMGVSLPGAKRSLGGRKSEECVWERGREEIRGRGREREEKVGGAVIETGRESGSSYGFVCWEGWIGWMELGTGATTSSG